MEHYNCRYGFFTTYKGTCFLKRVAANKFLYSSAVRCSQASSPREVSVREAFLFLAAMGYNDKESFYENVGGEDLPLGGRLLGYYSSSVLYRLAVVHHLNQNVVCVITKRVGFHSNKGEERGDSDRLASNLQVVLQITVCVTLPESNLLDEATKYMTDLMKELGGCGLRQVPAWSFGP
ncbi:hypothetical protein UA08_05275 [Talaromyces atroroseus]|uniref:Uncharacterized protein n=1 Tax=Talaromyces atroroseus TaxID=1441469 RepID=A0A225AYX6_TALAT|nr:hypothetical protein UA08_05275 [Talaromyces atroroseus]OKL59675.1 hypothetical protein UA08_05275 [Talaromyces atroroseus]